MGWETSNRRASLPPDWRKIRAEILRRDPTCKLAFDCCTARSTEVDHIGAATDHRPQMLRGVCTPCHKRRTQAQAVAAKPKQRRKPEAHPGLM